jgi:hypothetical protein
MFAEPIVLGTGQVVFLKQVDLSQTYGAFMEFTPTPDLHDRLIAGMTKRAAKRFFRTDPIPLVVVAPPRRPRAQDPPSPGRVLEEHLPHARVLGLFGSAPTDDAFTAAELVIGWFQDTYDLTAANVQQAIVGVDWPAHARDFDY